MKSYLLDSLNKFQRFSEDLDVKAVICNRSWWVFNDLGVKEIYIFKEDGELISSISGQVTSATWEYVSANKSIIIKSERQSIMVHAAFIRDGLFVLQIDGTNQYSFLINEADRNAFVPKSLSDLTNYFVSLEVEEQNRLERAKLARERQLIHEQRERLERIASERKTAELHAENTIKLEKQRQQKFLKDQQEFERREHLETILDKISSSDSYKEWSNSLGLAKFSTAISVLVLFIFALIPILLFIKLGDEFSVDLSVIGGFIAMGLIYPFGYLGFKLCLPLRKARNRYKINLLLKTQMLNKTDVIERGLPSYDLKEKIISMVTNEDGEFLFEKGTGKLVIEFVVDNKIIGTLNCIF